LDISKPVVRLRSGPALGRGEYARATGPTRRFQFDLAQPRLIGVLGALAIMLFVGAFTVPDLVRQGRGERVTALVTTAQAQIAAAETEADPARKRSLLEETRRLASEALRIEQQNATANELHAQASASLIALDAVLDLGPMTTVTTLSRQITGDVSVNALTVAGGRAYMVDSRGGRILSLPLTAIEAPVAVFQDGATYGGTPAKKPIFMTWQGSEATGSLLILDEERKLFQLTPGSSPQPVPLRRTNTWSSVAGIAAFDGNFYVLDPAGNRVHRYLPAALGFDSEPGPAVSAQLTAARGLAVDGDIIVYESDTLHRFRSGNDIGFGLGGIDRPPKAITAIAVAGDEVYLADSGNKRVVVAGKDDGIFRRQLVSNDFTDLRGLAVDAGGGQLYVVVGDALLTAPIVR
jgi:DNA-binding beta-propeller fold protein YncE